MVGLLVISNSGTYAADLDQKFTKLIYLSVFLLTFLIPVAIMPIFYYTGMAKNLQFSEKRERVLPLYITLFFYFASYLFIRKLPVSLVYQRFMFSACLSVLFVLTISYFWKISAHLVGWGGVVGLIVILTYRFGSDLMIFLMIAILISGITAFARLRLNEHNPLQVYSGFVLGFITVMAVFSV
jgi:membrane-associated phospholipid phosphatase